MCVTFGKICKFSPVLRLAVSCGRAAYLWAITTIRQTVEKNRKLNSKFTPFQPLDDCATVHK